MSEFDYILKSTSEELLHYLPHTLKRYGYTIKSDNDNYIFAYQDRAKAQLPLLVSHIDTIREHKTKDHTAIRCNDIYYFTIDGNPLGADDRSGVYIILSLLSKGYLFPVLFTNYEEKGGIGVQEFCHSEHIEYITDKVNFMIEYDRRGVNQYVYYTHALPDEIKLILKDYGFEENHGSYSDVATLTDYTKIAHVNISAGYVNEHTSREKLYLHYLDFIINTSSVMLKEFIDMPKMTISIPFDDYELFEYYIYDMLPKTLSNDDYWIIEELLNSCPLCKTSMIVCTCSIDALLDIYTLSKKQKKRLKKIITNIRQHYSEYYDDLYNYGSWEVEL